MDGPEPSESTLQAHHAEADQAAAVLMFRGLARAIGGAAAAGVAEGAAGADGIAGIEGTDGIAGAIGVGFMQGTGSVETGRQQTTAVYLAEHRRMGRAVALKVIHPALLRHAGALGRFQQEVRAAAKLDHPNIVSLLDSGTDHDAGVVAEAFAGAPTAGFFAAGEIGPVGGSAFLHGFTATVAVFPG